MDVDNNCRLPSDRYVPIWFYVVAPNLILISPPQQNEKGEDLVPVCKSIEPSYDYFLKAQPCQLAGYW